MHRRGVGTALLQAATADAVVHGRGELGAVLAEVRTYQHQIVPGEGPDLGEDLLAALRWTNATLAEPEPAQAQH